VLVVLQEVFGVNEGIRSIMRNYAAKAYIAIAPDLFWRAEPGLSMSEADPGSLEKGLSLYAAYDMERGVRDIATVIAAGRELDGASGRVGVTGYCLGGLLTFLCAARTDADAFAAYYGGGTERYLDEAKAISAPLLYHLAGADEYIGPMAQAAIRSVLEPMPNVELHVYRGRNHAFARPGGSHYDAADAGLANSRTDGFFLRHLG
jgi:carboxymethylenebutenolidase